jgi:hypothetical protein
LLGKIITLFILGFVLSDYDIFFLPKLPAKFQKRNCQVILEFIKSEFCGVEESKRYNETIVIKMIFIFLAHPPFFSQARDKSGIC